MQAREVRVVDVEDAVLVAAARGGDSDAFELLVRRHQAAVYGLALRMLGSEADAQDAAQDSFVQAWKALVGLRGDSAFATWLYRIVTNRCLNILAKRRPTDVLSDDHASARDDPAEAAMGRERMHAVAAAVLRLGPDQRAALVLREFQGLSYDEVAEVLGVSVAAVKGRIHRARLLLMEELGAWR